MATLCWRIVARSKKKRFLFNIPFGCFFSSLNGFTFWFSLDATLNSKGYGKRGCLTLVFWGYVLFSNDKKNGFIIK